MPFRIVQSKQNPRLKELRQALARPARGAGEIIALEGPNLLHEAVRGGIRIQCVFAAERELQFLPHLAGDTEVLSVPDALLRNILSTECPQLVAALVEVPGWTWREVVAKDDCALVVVLAGVQDPGNLGTILRSAEAFGATGVIALPGTVSPWNPKALRASAGSAFRLPFLHTTVEDCFHRLRESGIKVWTTALTSATALDKTDLTAPIALVIGNEGNGVPDEIARRADEAITIPCPGPVESLNAGVAAAVVLYEASRQRRAAARILEVVR